MSTRLAHSPAQVIQRLLVAKGVGVLPSAGGNWPIFATKEADRPDNCITVGNSAGVMLAATQVDGEWWEQRGIQVRIRAALDEDAYAKAAAIAELMDKAPNNVATSYIYRESVTIGSDEYCIHSLNRTSSILSLGDLPNSSRRVYTVNCLSYILKV